MFFVAHFVFRRTSKETNAANFKKNRMLHPLSETGRKGKWILVCAPLCLHVAAGPVLTVFYLYGSQPFRETSTRARKFLKNPATLIAVYKIYFFFCCLKSVIFAISPKKRRRTRNQRGISPQSQ